MRKQKPREGEIIPSIHTRGWDAAAPRDLSPGRLSSILRNLDAGDVADAMRLFDEMEERDPHLGAVTQTRVLAAVAKDRDVMPASGSDEDAMIAEFVRENFESIPRRQELFAALMGAVMRGFSIAEIIWRTDGGMAVVEDILPRPQWLFSFINPDDPATLLDFPRYLGLKTPYGAGIPRDKFIFHRGGGGAHCVRSGLYRGMAWYYLFTSFTIKDWLTFIDLYGVPLRLGKYKKTADDRARDVLKQAVMNLGSDAAAVISEDTTIEFINSALSGDHALFRDAADYFNRQKSKRILGQTLTTETAGSGGAYALGKVHDRVRHDIIAYDCRALDETLNHDLVRPLVEFNFGPRKAYPKIVTRLSRAGETDEKLGQIRKIVELGAKVPARVVAQITGAPLTGDLDAPLAVEAGKGAGL